MNIVIMYVDENGKSYNSDDHEVIPCRMKCGRFTTRLIVKLCDICMKEQQDEHQQGRASHDPDPLP